MAKLKINTINIIEINVFKGRATCMTYVQIKNMNVQFIYHDLKADATLILITKMLINSLLTSNSNLIKTKKACHLASFLLI